MIRQIIETEQKHPLCPPGYRPGAPCRRLRCAQWVLSFAHESRSDTVSDSQRDDSRTRAHAQIQAMDIRDTLVGQSALCHREQRRALPAPITSGREADGLRVTAADLGAIVQGAWQTGGGPTPDR